MKRDRKASRWATALLAVAAALATVVGAFAPTPAQAKEATLNDYLYRGFIITSCPECNGLPHPDVWSVAGIQCEWDFENAGLTWAGFESATSADESVVKPYYDAAHDQVIPEPMGKLGTAQVTVTSTSGDKLTVDVQVYDVYKNWDEYIKGYDGDEAKAEASLAGDHYIEPTSVEIDGSTEVGTSWGMASLHFLVRPTDNVNHLSYTTSVSSSDSSVLSAEIAGDQTVTLTPHKAGVATITVTATDNAHSGVAVSGSITVTVVDDGEPLPEPWAADGSLLPYTIKDGVMTFDGRPDLGEWYQLDLDLGEGVTSGGNIGGAAMWTMTIGANSLDPSDPLYDASGWKDGPFWVRADNRGAYSGYSLTVPEGKALSTSLEGKGTLVPSGNGSILLVQLSGPSTLHASVADQTVITNEQGATLAHTPNDGDYGSDGMWSSLTLVTDWLGGDEAQTATNAVVAAVPGVTGHPYVYDIHLLDMFGDVFQIPDGDSVTVTLPIPEGLSADGLHVFHVADDGTVTDMGATVDAEAGTVSFTTTHFSTFVLANVTSDDGVAGSGSDTKQASSEKDVDKNKLAATGDAGSIAALLAAASGSVALLGSRVIRKRR